MMTFSSGASVSPNETFQAREQKSFVAWKPRIKFAGLVSAPVSKRGLEASGTSEMKLPRHFYIPRGLIGQVTCS